MTLTAYKQPLHYYGLHPTVWRKLRSIIGGCCDLELYNHSNRKIGTGILNRYSSHVSIPKTLSFMDISWKATIQKCQPQHDGEVAFLGPSKIPIGVNSI